MKDKAIENFRNNLNCAQSVLAAFAEQYNLDKNAALSIACGFGAGMGRLQETCGAVTGSFMVLGVHNCKKLTDNKERKQVTYGMIQEFEKRFKKTHGTIKCADILNIDLRTEEGQHLFHDQDMGRQICEQCIADAVKIVEDLTA